MNVITTKYGDNESVGKRKDPCLKRLTDRWEKVKKQEAKHVWVWARTEEESSSTPSKGKGQSDDNLASLSVSSPLYVR